MIHYTIKDCTDWCRHNGFSVGASGYPCIEDAEGVWYKCPQNYAEISRASSAIAREFFKANDNILLIITGWPFYTQLEWSMMQTVRRGFGINESILQSPGALCGASDGDAASVFLFIIILFGWDAVLLGDRMKTCMFMVHEKELYTNLSCIQDLDGFAMIN